MHTLSATHSKIQEKDIIYIESYLQKRTSEETPVFAIESTKKAIKFIQSLREDFNGDVQIILGILVNDLGNQKIKKVNELPSPIQEIITNNPNIQLEAQHIASETNLRNKAVKYFKKLLKNINIHESISQNEGILISDSENQPLLTGRYVNDSKDINIFFHSENGNPARILTIKENGQYLVYCSAIIAEHYRNIDIFLEQTNNNNNKIIIDFSNRISKISVTVGSEIMLKLLKTTHSTLQIWNGFSTNEGRNYSFYCSQVNNDNEFEMNQCKPLQLPT